MPVDLTPFGFTPTESHAYGALLELGPASGYAVAKRLSIARANGYQALDGLVAKGACSLLAERPRRYRALRPSDLFAQIIEQEAGKLDRLEHEIMGQDTDSAGSLVPVQGMRALTDTVTRAVIRTTGPVLCVAPAQFLEVLVPAWRARAAAGREMQIWSVERAAELPGIPSHVAAPDAVRRAFAVAPTLLCAGSGALCAQTEPEAGGYWSSGPIFVGAIKAAIAGITGT